ncbi:MAG: hypothetical protein K5925_03370 [Bacilli bacterium]|nr:hypothetical protein [Bacilli bacterium]
MFGKELAHDETYYKEYGEYKITNSYTVYEAYIEEMHDKEGKLVTNKDGSPRYRYIDDRDISTVNEDKLVKEIRPGLYKDVYQVNGDYVEKVEKEGKRIYFVVEQARVKTLAKDSKVVARNGTYRLLSEVGYVLVDDYEIENPKVIAVRKFKTEDHEQEAKDIIKNKIRRFSGEE